jgi:hypothetical protein
MPFATFLLSMVQPILFQALVALGVGVLTVSGIDLAVNQCQSWLNTAVGGIPADMSNVLAMAGVFQGIAYIGGGISARVAVAGASSFKKFFLQ